MKNRILVNVRMIVTLVKSNMYIGKLIDKYGVNKQIIFTHYNDENCRHMYETVNDIRTMLWIGGSPEKIKNKFNDDRSLHILLDIGIRWFAVDYPEEFIASVKMWE